MKIPSCRLRASRRGLTLVEVVVTVAIIGLLVALILPAVQAAREAARRTQCVNNFRQLGIGLNSFEVSMGWFPSSNNGGKGYSAFSLILRELEQPALFDSINFSVRPYDESNRTVAGASLAVLLCPSDSASGYGSGCTNYGFNVGYGYQTSGTFNGAFAFESNRPTSSSTITDGLSSTVFMSEWSKGSNSSVAMDRLGLVFQPPSSMPRPDEFEAFNEHCLNLSPVGGVKTWSHKGYGWLRTGMGRSLYNHNLTPNRNSCLNGSLILEGTWSAGSRHAHGVNVLFGDGHVRFVKESIAIALWRAASTRADGEATGPID